MRIDCEHGVPHVENEDCLKLDVTKCDKCSTYEFKGWKRVIEIDKKTAEAESMLTDLRKERRRLLYE